MWWYNKKENKLVLLRFNKVRQTTEIKDGLYFFFMGLGSCFEKLKNNLVGGGYSEK